MNVEYATRTTVAEQFKQDPRVEEGKQLILAALREHQRQITSVRPPRADLEMASRKLLEEFSTVRGGSLYFPYLATGMGHGPFVELIDGSVKLDFITGIGVHGFGHSNPMLVEAGLDAAMTDSIMQGNLQQGVESFHLMKLLTDTAMESGAMLDRCVLSTSGAMANENALKIAFQKNAPADRVIAFEHCFAGRTLVLSQITDKASNRVGMPTTVAVDYIPFFDPADPTGSTERAIACLKELIHRYPGRHALLWMELIQGEGGYYVGDRKFFRALVQIARKYKLAFIADEIQTFARTSRPFAFQHFGLDDLVDIVTLGKISQVCATLYTHEYQPQPGLISQTFTGSSSSIFASLQIVNALRGAGHFGEGGRNERLFARFAKGLSEISSRHPDGVSGPFGIGGMVAFTPFDGSAQKAKAMVQKLYELGLMSFIAGSHPVRVRFLMPIGAVSEEHIEVACEIIEQAVVELKKA